MAGALTKRDIEMIFRAETDKATRPIGELKTEVKGLRQALDEQVKAADRGEVSLDNLATTTRDLKKAQDELGTARSLLTSLNSQVNSLEKASQRAEETAAKYAQLKTQVEGAEKPTKRLTGAMEAAGRAAEAAAEKEQRITAEVAQTREQIEAIIGPISNFQNSFRTIAETSKEVARGLAISGQAADDFKQKLASLDAAQKAAAGDQAFLASASGSGLLQEQINYISQFENRVELLAQAKRELIAQNTSFDQALSAQQARVGADNVSRLRAQFEETASAAARLENVNAFRGIAAQANAATNDVARFGVTFDTGAASAERLADAIIKIVAPATAANQTIDGLEDSVRQAAAVLAGEGKRSAQEYNVAMNALSAATAAAVAQARDVDAFRIQQAALTASTARFQAAQAEVKQLAAALSTADEPTEEMARALRTAETALEQAGKEMQRDANIAEQLGAKLRRASVDTNNLAAADKRLAQAAREAAKAQGEISAKTGGRGGAFGFSLQDAQNFGYQINDLITQVASGTPIMQAFAQQAGQIYQIPAIQNMIGAFARWIPIIAVAAATVGVLAAAINRVTDKAEAVKQTGAYLATLGNDSAASAEQLGTAQIALQDLGVAAKEAQKAVREFNNAGLDPTYLKDFYTAAKNASDVTGVEFPQAAELLTAALSGGYDEAAKLDDQFHFLTDAERVHIRAMYDSGQESEARELIFSRFYEKMGEGAEKMNGPWSNAVNNFKAVFKSFLDYLGTTTVVTDFIKSTNDAITGLNFLLLLMRGNSIKDAGNIAANGQGRQPTGRTTRGAPGTGSQTSAAGQQAINDAKRELDVRKRLTAEERLRNAAIDARRKAPAGATPAERAELARLAQVKEQNAINDENAKKNAKSARAGASAAKRAQNEADALEKRIDSAVESLHGNLDRVNAQVAKVAIGSITDQLAAANSAVDSQFAKLYRQLEDFKKLAGSKATIDGLSQADYKAQLDANKVILQNQAQLGVYESNINALIAQRKSLLASIEEQVQAGTLTSANAATAISEVTSKLNPLIADLAQAGITFATSIAGANPSPELQAFLAKLQSMQTEARNVGTGSTAAVAQTFALNADEANLNKIISERNSLIAATNTLVELGLVSQIDAQHRVAEAFKQTQGPINAQVAGIRATVEAMHQQGTINDTVYNAWIAKLQAVSAQAQYTDANVLALNNLVQEELLAGGTAVFNSLAQGIANFATGAGSLIDVFKGVGVAFANFAAQFLAKIAQMIIQALLFQAIQSAIGLPGGGGGLGGLIFGSVKHGGGTIGNLGSQRRRAFNISPAAMAAIPRYHEGTPKVGLKHNERLAVLETGEKVLTEEQQRREAASKAGGSKADSIRQVLVLGDDEIAGAMLGPAGEKTIVTQIRRNKATIKQMLKD